MNDNVTVQKPGAATRYEYTEIHSCYQQRAAHKR